MKESLRAASGWMGNGSSLMEISKSLKEVRMQVMHTKLTERVSGHCDFSHFLFWLTKSDLELVVARLQVQGVNDAHVLHESWTNYTTINHPDCHRLTFHLMTWA